MTTLLEQAVTYIKEGDTEKAKHFLAEHIKQNPRDENAWLWMSRCLTDVTQKKDCFQRVLQVNPNNQFAQEGLRRLEATRNTPPVSSVKVAPKKSSFLTLKNILIIGGFVFICVALPVGAIALNMITSPKPIILPSPTNVPVVIDAISLIGKSLDEIRLQYKVTDSLYDLSPSEPDKDYADIDSGEDYTDGKYRFTAYYNKDFIVNQVDLNVPYYIDADSSRMEPRYKMSEWRAVMQMLNLNITLPPDETKGNEDIPFAYVWKNYNGYRIWINRVGDADIILYAKVIKLK